MKYCPYCGQDYPDDAMTCATDGNPLRVPGEPERLQPPPLPVHRPRAVLSAAEQRFWERMTFKQFAVLMLRLQALLLFLYAAIDTTYLIPYLRRATAAGLYGGLSVTGALDLFLLVLRLGMYVAAGIVLSVHTDKVLRWMVKDLVSTAPAGQEPLTSAELRPR